MGFPEWKTIAVLSTNTSFWVSRAKQEHAFAHKTPMYVKRALGACSTTIAANGLDTIPGPSARPCKYRAVPLS